MNSEKQGKKVVMDSYTRLLEGDIKPGIENALRETTEHGVNDENTGKTKGFSLLKDKMFLLAKWFDGRHPYTQDIIAICRNYFKDETLDRAVLILADFVRETEPKISAKKGVLNFRFASFISKGMNYDLSEALQAIVYLSNCGLAKWPFNEVETANVAFILLNTMFYHNTDPVIALFEQCINPGIDLSHLNQEKLAKGFERIYELRSYYFENPLFIAFFFAKKENQEFKNFLFNRLKTEAILDGRNWKVEEVCKTIESVERFIKSLRMVAPESTDVEYQIERKNFLEKKVKSVVSMVPLVFFGEGEVNTPIDPEIKELSKSYIEEYTNKHLIHNYLNPWKSVIMECYETVCNHLKAESRGLTVIFNVDLLKSHYESTVKKLYLELMNTFSEEKNVEVDSNSNDQLPDREKIKDKISEFVKWIFCYRIVSALEKELKTHSLPEFFIMQRRHITPINIFSSDDLRPLDEFVETLTGTVRAINETLKTLRQQFDGKTNLKIEEVASRIRELLKDEGTPDLLAHSVIHELESRTEKSDEKSFLSVVKEVLGEKAVNYYAKKSIEFPDLIFILLEAYDLIEKTHPEEITEYKSLVTKILCKISRIRKVYGYQDKPDNVYEIIFTEKVHNENSLKKIVGFHTLLNTIKALRKEIGTRMSYSIQKNYLDVTLKSEIDTSLILAVINAKIIEAFKRKNVTGKGIEKFYELYTLNGIPFPKEIKDFTLEKVCFYFYELVADSEPKVIKKGSEPVMTQVESACGFTTGSESNEIEFNFSTPFYHGKKNAKEPGCKQLKLF